MPMCGRPRPKQSFQKRHHDRGSPEKPEKGKRLVHSWESDKAARKLPGQPRGTSVFAAPCRGALTAKTHAEASAINRQKTGRGLSQQAFGIGRKIKQVDDAITPDIQRWAFEVHPEVCFWKLNGERPSARIRRTPGPFGRDEGPVAAQLCGQTKLVRALDGA
jgi:predicted RNase H-like nuclease